MNVKSHLPSAPKPNCPLPARKEIKDLDAYKEGYKAGFSDGYKEGFKNNR